MKTAELTAIGLTEEQATQVLAMNGKDIESAKAAKDKVIADLTGERDDYKARLETAETTLKNFEGIDPEKIQQEIQSYRQKAEDAEKDFAKKLLQRDQTDWLKGKMEYASPMRKFREALTAACKELERLEIITAHKIEDSTKGKPQLALWLPGQA